MFFRVVLLGYGEDGWRMCTVEVTEMTIFSNTRTYPVLTCSVKSTGWTPQCGSALTRWPWLVYLWSAASQPHPQHTRCSLTLSSQFLLLDASGTQPINSDSFPNLGPRPGLLAAENQLYSSLMSSVSRTKLLISLCLLVPSVKWR